MILLGINVADFENSVVTLLPSRVDEHVVPVVAVVSVKDNATGVQVDSQLPVIVYPLVKLYVKTFYVKLRNIFYIIVF